MDSMDAVVMAIAFSGELEMAALLGLATGRVGSAVLAETLSFGNAVGDMVSPPMPVLDIPNFSIPDSSSFDVGSLASGFSFGGD